MTAAQLTRVVANVGESTKRGQPWLNGQFGFGIHGACARGRGRAGPAR